MWILKVHREQSRNDARNLTMMLTKRGSTASLLICGLRTAGFELVPQEFLILCITISHPQGTSRYARNQNAAQCSFKLH